MEIKVKNQVVNNLGKLSLFSSERRHYRFQWPPIFMELHNFCTKYPLDAWSNELNQRLDRHSCKAGRIQKDTTLLHKLKSGKFTELGQVKDLEVCVLQCCESRHCDLALFKDHFCYGITCYSPQHCKTVPAYEDDKMIAVFLTKAKTNITKQGVYCIVAWNYVYDRSITA